MQKKITPYLRDAFIISFVTLFLAEIALRMMGYQAFNPPSFSIIAEPQTTLVPHPKWGLALRPNAEFQVTMGGSHQYHTTHLSDSTRYTGASDSTGLENVHFYGCSFTYGMGVNDEQTFPYLLQKKLPTLLQVHNKSIPGHGTIQSLLLLRQQLNSPTPPDRVFLGYAAFHDDRNVLSPYYREHLRYGFQQMSPAVAAEFDAGSGAIFPYGKIQQGKLEIQQVSMQTIFKPVPLREYLAFANLIQGVINRRRHQALDKEAVTLVAVQEMQQLCQQANIPFTIISVTQDEQTTQALQRFEKAGIATLNMGVDTNNPKYNHHPYDSHPNAQAHRIYADKLLQYLGKEYLSH